MTDTTTHSSTTAAAVTYTPGAFVWHEYVSNDTRGARKFYAELFGWNIKSTPMEGAPEYPEIFAGDVAIGGFFQLDAKVMQVPAHWFGYVSVPDVDAAVAKAKAAGAKVLVEAKDIPQVGRFATLMDPQGAVFAVFRCAFGDPPGDRMPGLGEICWDSLGTTDVNAATKFYGTVVGWTATDGVFKMGELMEASYDAAPPGVPAHWLAHFYVKNLDESRAKLQQLGGKVLMAQIDIPYGRFAVVQDPDGATFSLFEPNQGQ